MTVRGGQQQQSQQTSSKPWVALTYTNKNMTSKFFIWSSLRQRTSKQSHGTDSDGSCRTAIEKNLIWCSKKLFELKSWVGLLGSGGELVANKCGTQTHAWPTPTRLPPLYSWYYWHRRSAKRWHRFYHCDAPILPLWRTYDWSQQQHDMPNISGTRRPVIFHARAEI